MVGISETVQPELQVNQHGCVVPVVIDTFQFEWRMDGMSGSPSMQRSLAIVVRAAGNIALKQGPLSCMITESGVLRERDPSYGHHRPSKPLVGTNVIHIDLTCQLLTGPVSKMAASRSNASDTMRSCTECKCWQEKKVVISPAALGECNRQTIRTRARVCFHSCLI
jgi:hypothetical protein